MSSTSAVVDGNQVPELEAVKRRDEDRKVLKEWTVVENMYRFSWCLLIEF